MITRKYNSPQVEWFLSHQNRCNSDWVTLAVEADSLPNLLSHGYRPQFGRNTVYNGRRDFWFWANHIYTSSLEHTIHLFRPRYINNILFMKLVTVNRSSFCLQWFARRDVQQQEQVHLSCAAPPPLHKTAHQHTTTSHHTTFTYYYTTIVICLRSLA